MPSNLDIRKEDHETFEASVIDWLASNGFNIPKAQTYHEIWDESHRNMIVGRNCMTASRIKHQADRVAIDSRSLGVFYWEAKTIPSFRKQGDDWFMEAIPLAQHLSEAEFGVRCLYILSDMRKPGKSEFGFWASPSGLPNVSVCGIPKRWSGEPVYIERVRLIMGKWFPRTVIVEGNQCGNSGTPFVKFNADEIYRLSHWHNEVFRLRDLFGKPIANPSPIL